MVVDALPHTDSDGRVHACTLDDRAVIYSQQRQSFYKA